MIQTRRSSARSFMAALLAVLLVLTGAMATVAQSPEPSTGPSTSIGAAVLGNPTLGGALAADEGRDTSGPANLVLGTRLDGTKIDGTRSAFRPDESFAFRLELPEPVQASTLHVQLAGSVDGAEALWAYPDVPIDPSWDTVASTLPAPPVGDYTLRVFKGETLLAEAAISSADVPRLTALVTDPNGFVTADLQRVSDAGKRYEDATGGGWMWNVLIDTTNGVPMSDWAADLWAVNADQIDPRDAMLVAAAGDIDLAVLVGSDAARTIVPDELSEIEDEAVFALGDARFADMIDGVADGLVAAHEEGPEASPSPTPEATPSPTPSTVRVPNFVDMTRDEAELLAARRGLEVEVTFRRSSDAPKGTVIEQDPPAGKSVERGSTVTIVVATAPSTVKVPDLAGLSESDAIGVLLDAGLEPGTRTRRFSETIAEGDVIRTDPAADTAVAPGSTVDYIVSRGPNPNPTATPTPTPKPTATPKPVPQVTVPVVRDQTQDDAIAIILDAKLKVGEIREVPNEKIASGRATKTIPEAGSKVDRGSEIILLISTGPSAPIVTPAPTETPGPVESFPATGDRLTRSQDTGVIRVNLADDDAPWSSINSNNVRVGLDVAIARNIAKALGVKLEVTTFPIEEVRAGLWDDRFDIAVSRLAVTDADPAVLAFSAPYAYDPQQLAVTAESGLTTPEELADRAVCTAAGDTGEAWLNGSLALVGAPLEPAAPPSGATAFAGPTNGDCLALIAATGAPFDGWLASLPTVDDAIEAGSTVAEVGVPVFWAPVAVAFDAKAGDNDALISAVNDILVGLDDAGTLVKASIRNTGYDLTTVPEDGVPVPVTPVSETVVAP